MATRLQHLHNLRQIFHKSVESVRPHQLLSEGNGYHLYPDVVNRSIELQNNTFDLTNKKCHVVGFGKAVLGMAVQLEKSLGPYLRSGVLSIPKGTRQQMPEMCASSCLQVIEGAENNHPDEEAARAAWQIKKLSQSMTPNDILFVLISGGGSALLPMPKSPCTLAEKTQLIRQLANKGASIDDINVVRICLSDVKGGQLAYAARHANAVISFVISDIVGDPVDLIASGPTCSPQTRRNTSAQDVLTRYGMWSDLPEHIRALIREEYKSMQHVKPSSNNFIYVVGDNRVATSTAVRESLVFGYNPFIATTSLQGDVVQLADMYMDFLKSIVEFRRKDIDEESLKTRFPFDSRIFQHFLKTMLMCEKTKKPLLLIMAGEPTVKVTGSGLGGRNQELALRMSLIFHNCPDFSHISFLSAGTDGIDGPTPAAGSIGSSLVIEDYLNAGGSLDCVSEFLRNNDSYNFYAEINSGAHHVITGHTGTNVMDLQLILVP